MKIYLLLAGFFLFIINAEAKPAQKPKLGIKSIDEGLTITMKFECGTKPYKIRAFRYKIQVLEKEKPLSVEGTQRTWLSKNVTMLKLKYNKKRKIDFKHVEISTNKWIRSFPEQKLSEPIQLSLEQCKDMGSY
jgi:hypothetical protein